MVSARPQDYDDYDKQAARSQQKQQQPQQPLQQNRAKIDDRDTTTWIPIIQYDKEQSIDGSYKTRWVKWKWMWIDWRTKLTRFWSYETGNNILAEESGYLKDRNDDNPTGTLVQKGSYSYESPDGQASSLRIIEQFRYLLLIIFQIINVQYQADEQGFRVNGEHLPTPPPVSAEIQKGLDLIYEGIRLQAERRKSDPTYNDPKNKEERERLNYLGLYTGN